MPFNILLFQVMYFGFPMFVLMFVLVLWFFGSYSHFGELEQYEFGFLAVRPCT